MKDRSIRCALWLQSQNITINDIVAISANNLLDNYVPMLATFYLKAIYNAWNHEQTLGRKEPILE